MPELDGWIARAEGVQYGRITYGERIERVETHGALRTQPTDDAPRILPGFVDGHVHGGGGGDTMDGPDGVLALARHHLSHGTTTLLPTTMTQRWDRVTAALRGVADVTREQGEEILPDIPGAHLEGPFISPDRLGAQPPYAVLPTRERLDEVLEVGVVRVVTMAPELEGAIDAARAFARANVRVSVGHTCATPDQVRALGRAVREEGGTLGFTHLYNAMDGLKGREPGVVGACFADPDAYAELILDGHHVYEVAVLAARAAKAGRLHLVTDAIRACGLPEGRTELGGQEVTVAGGAARLADGGLAGSVLTLDAAVRRAVAFGIPLAEAASMAAHVPAGYLGLDDRGRLEPGSRADMVVMDADLTVRRVVAAGRDAPAAG